MFSHFNIEDERSKATFLAYYALWFHERQEKAAEMEIKIICAVYGEGAVTDRTCQKWFVKFCAEDFS